MFRNHESPISLFSFQDIITCLTGIMLFFLLILALKIMEITKLLEQQSPYRTEITQWQQRNDLLKRQLEEIARDIGDYRKRIRSARHKDRATLSIVKFRLERRLREVQLRAAELQKLRSLREEEKRRAELRKKQLEDQQRQLRESADALERIDRQNRTYRERIKQLRDEINKRKRTVQVSVSGKTNKKPVVIECSRDRIRIVELQSRNVVVVPRTTPFFSEMVNAALRRLQDYPKGEYYFAFLMKPSSACYARYFTAAFEKRFPGIESGIEPIMESEACD